MSNAPYRAAITRAMEAHLSRQCSAVEKARIRLSEHLSKILGEDVPTENISYDCYSDTVFTVLWKWPSFYDDSREIGMVFVTWANAPHYKHTDPGEWIKKPNNNNDGLFLLGPRAWEVFEAPCKLKDDDDELIWESLEEEPAYPIRSLADLGEVLHEWGIMQGGETFPFELPDEMNEAITEAVVACRPRRAKAWNVDCPETPPTVPGVSWPVPIK